MGERDKGLVQEKRIRNGTGCEENKEWDRMREEMTTDRGARRVREPFEIEEKVVVQIFQY